MGKYIISAKPDGFGMRLSSLIVAIAVAKKLEMKFNFIWPESMDLDFINIRSINNKLNVNYIANDIPKKEEIFSKNFLDSYLYKEYIYPNHGQNISKKKRSISELKNTQEMKIGWFSTDKIPALWIKKYPIDECYYDLGIAFNEIQFSDKYKRIIKKAEKIASELNNNFISLHIRGGEMIYGPSRRLTLDWIINERYFPYEIAYEILKTNQESTTVVLFGQDIDSNKALKALFKNTNKNIILVDEVIDLNYDSNERAFFELILMSKSNKIISAKESAFSKTSAMISGKNILSSYHDIYSDRKQIKYILKNNQILNLHKMQQAMAYSRLGDIYKKRFWNYNKAIKCYEKAYELDNTNETFLIFKMILLLKLKKYNTLNTFLYSIEKNNKLVLFLEVLFSHHKRRFAYIFNKIISYKGNLKYINYLKIIIIINTTKINYINDNIISTNSYLEQIVHNKKIVSSSGEFITYNHLSYILGQALTGGSFYIKIFKIFFILPRDINKFYFIKSQVINQNNNKNYYDYDKVIQIKNSYEYLIGKTIIYSFKNILKGELAILPFKLYNIYKNKRKD